jgi:hypothetical protein
MWMVFSATWTSWTDLVLSLKRMTVSRFHACADAMKLMMNETSASCLAPMMMMAMVMVEMSCDPMSWAN